MRRSRTTTSPRYTAEVEAELRRQREVCNQLIAEYRVKNGTGYRAMTADLYKRLNELSGIEARAIALQQDLESALDALENARQQIITLAAERDHGRRAIAALTGQNLRLKVINRKLRERLNDG